jgi:hypothetical protein
MSRLVVVDLRDLRDLVDAADQMAAHEDAGVDNWSGRDNIEWPDEDTLDERTAAYIKGYLSE